MKVIIETLEQIVRDMGADAEVVLTRPDAQFGEFACNVALQLSKQLGKNPREIAQDIADKMTTIPEVRTVNVAGPGFINITLTDEALYEIISQPQAKTLQGRKILVEYSDPNPFKPLHVGHLYTALVGDTMARLIENAGAETIRLNYSGDVGLHVARSMWAIIRYIGGESPDKLDDVPEAERAEWLGVRYVEGTAAYEDDEAAKAEIIECNKRVYALHDADDHESNFAKIYWTCRTWSYDYFPRLYQQLEITPFARFIPESEVTPLGVKTVREQLLKGVYRESDGAVVFDGEAYGLHTRVFINSAGLPTYETKDVGLSLTKWRDYQFDQSIIITAAEQQQYMQVVLKSIEQFAPEPALRTLHLTHGLVKLVGGVKMSSRKGNVLLALELLDASRRAARANRENASEDTVLAAVKYAFAKVKVGGDIVYDPSESVALEGNSGPYLQYAHARACSILSKAQSEKEEGSKKKEELEQDERLLLRKLTEYKDVVEKATTDLMPHHICNYLYELAQEFNRFYEKNRVIGDAREATRLSLVMLYRDTLARGLALLGIAAPESM
ncbi:MAG: arginine--tRNA ligase [Candidatus Saccharimonadales bacterium]|jgi:arginyl-tRNA synthetase